MDMTKPKCGICGEPSTVFCSFHQKNFCAKCADLHAGPGCYFCAAVPLAMMSRPQMELGFDDERSSDLQV
jgi:hypothetical protein